MIEYYKGIRGYRKDKWYPSVSAVLDVLQGNGKWLPPELVETGVRCHEALHIFLKGGPYPVDSEILFRILPIIEYLEDKKIIHTEETFFGDGYAGTVDCVCNPTEVTLIDFKFTEAFPDIYRTQLAAYTHLLPQPYKVVALQVNKKGDLKERIISDIDERYEYFRAALRVLEYRLGE